MVGKTRDAGKQSSQDRAGRWAIVLAMFESATRGHGYTLCHVPRAEEARERR